MFTVQKQAIPEQSTSKKGEEQNKDIHCRQCNWLAPRHRRPTLFIKSQAKINNAEFSGLQRFGEANNISSLWVLKLVSPFGLQDWSNWWVPLVFSFPAVVGKRIQLIDLFFNV
ncbi:hypothetical protein AVEN_269862-1 [Araneus ventricosus]|uniref:Uncharacterized protein n=1 Tax=Araneus ventricosus TaxID=182803 RepID=A0A4Y2CGL4_ARAVE|nr:hypothetical protein AVEN_269862-1 [Araneus ventricosus]